MPTEHVSRFYSLALGKYKNFQVKTDGLIAEEDATPDVSLHSLLYANNSSTVVITHFDNGAEGQIVHLFNLGSDLSFQGNQLKLTDSSNLAQNDYINFIFSNSSWYEIGRSHSAGIDVATADVSDATPSVKNKRVLIFNSAGALIVTDFDDGYEGQELTVMNIGAGNVALQRGVQLFTSDSSILATQDVATFVQRSAAWYELSRSHNVGATVIATQADSTPSVKNVRVLVIANSASQPITDFDDGYEGQLLTVVCHGSSFWIDTGGNLINVGTAGAYIVLSNDAVNLVRYGSIWRVPTYAQTP